MEITVYCIKSFQTSYVNFEKNNYYQADIDTFENNIYIFVKKEKKNSIGHRFYYEYNDYSPMIKYITDNFNEYFENYIITERRLKLNNINEKYKNKN